MSQRLGSHLLSKALGILIFAEWMLAYLVEANGASEFPHI